MNERQVKGLIPGKSLIYVGRDHDYVKLFLGFVKGQVISCNKDTGMDVTSWSEDMWQQFTPFFPAMEKKMYLWAFKAYSGCPLAIDDIFRDENMCDEFGEECAMLSTAFFKMRLDYTMIEVEVE